MISRGLQTVVVITILHTHGDRGSTGWSVPLPALKERGQTVGPRSPWSPEGCIDYHFPDFHMVRDATDLKESAVSG